MPNSPLLFGPNGTAINLQTGQINADGSRTRYDGDKNYIANATMESNTTTGWSLFNTSLTSGLPTGSITLTASSLALTATSTNPLSGTYSLQMLAAAATTAGQGIISTAFTLDRADASKVLTFKMAYECTTGPTQVNFSGTLGSQSYAVYIYDVTASAWIQPTGFLGINQSSGSGVVTGTFQSGPTVGNQYQICIICLQATGGASTFTFDDFYVGPQTAQMGFVGTDPIAKTVTGSWVSNTTYTCLESRAGNFAYYDILIALAGAPTSASLTVNLPTGRTIDTALLTKSTASFGDIDNLACSIVSAGVAYSGDIVYNNTTSVGVFVKAQNVFAGTAYTKVMAVTQAVPATFANADYIRLAFRVPIVGWTSNVQCSNDTDTRVVAMNALLQTPTGTLTNSFNVTKFGTVTKDTHGSAYSTSTGLYTVPISGWYRISGIVEITATYTAAQHSDVKVCKNGTGGTGVALGSYTSVGSATAYPAAIPYSGLIECVAGDTLGVYAESNGSSLSYTAVASASTLFIERLSGPSVIAATESVSMKYTNTAGTSMANSGTNNVPWATKIWDTHNAFSGTQYVVPVSGRYLAEATIEFSSNLYATGNVGQLSIFVNTAIASYGPGVYAWSATSVNLGVSVATMLTCNAGDLIETRAFNNRTAGATTLSTTAGINHFQIVRVGN